MSQINVYLSFKGNCREAMNFYKNVLGGQLEIQTVGESPMAAQMPPQMKDAVLHAALTNGKLILMGSDLVGKKGLIKGTAATLSLHCDSEQDCRAFFSKLSEGGEIGHPLETTFWGALMGDFTDKYGNQWLTIYDKSAHPSN